MQAAAGKDARAGLATFGGGNVSPEDLAGSSATLILPDALFTALAPIFVQRRTIRLLATCRRSLDLVSAASKLHPDVLLLPAGTEEPTLRMVLRQMRRHAHETKTLIVSERCDREFISMILRYGAKGCLRPAASLDDFCKAILAVKMGDVWLERRTLADALSRLIQEQDPGAAPAKAGPPESCDPLTERENEIGELLTQGLTNKEIARKLSVSRETVKTHLKRLFIKLGVHRRTQVILHHSGWRRIVP